MRTVRGLTFGVGMAVALIGGWYLADLGLDNLFATMSWLVGGVIAHDALLAPATIGLVLVVPHLVPGWLRAPVTVGFVVLGSVTLLAIPVLGRFGARPDNPTLLDRDYWYGWLVLAVVTVAGVAVGGARRGRRSRVRGDMGQSR